MMATLCLCITMSIGYVAIYATVDRICKCQERKAESFRRREER